MGNRICAAVALGALLFAVTLQVQLNKQSEQISAGLTVIAASQVQLVSGQAAGNATLSMIHTTAVESLNLQQTQAAGAAQEVSK